MFAAIGRDDDLGCEVVWGTGASRHEAELDAVGWIWDWLTGNPKRGEKMEKEVKGLRFVSISPSQAANIKDGAVYLHPDGYSKRPPPRNVGPNTRGCSWNTRGCTR